MFTGIIEELGEVRRLSKGGRLARLEIAAQLVTKDAAVGDSISVNGACLTVTGNDRGMLSFEVMPETLRATNLGGLRPMAKVNLERSLKLGSRVSGHFVAGHVDCTGVIRQKRHREGNLEFEIAVPPAFISCVILKGSVAVDGISLTVAKKRSNAFGVYVIPHTLKNTTLGFKGPSEKVNVEFDMLAKRK